MDMRGAGVRVRERERKGVECTKHEVLLWMDEGVFLAGCAVKYKYI